MTKMTKATKTDCRIPEKWPPILYFGNEWRADNRTSSHHIARQFMRCTKVVYVECPGLRPPAGTGRDIKRLIAKVAKAFKGPQRLDDRSYVYTLLQLPFHSFTLVRLLNRLIIVASLRRLCRKLKIHRPVLWFVVPHLSNVLGRLDESLSVYYCIDDYASLPGVDKAQVQAMDDTMTIGADVVFVSSEPLLREKSTTRRDVILSRHGVDFEHFNRALTDRLEVPADVLSLRHPVIGFFGLIESWVDLDLIQFLATNRPQWSFLMIGRVAVSSNPCKGLANVHFIGSRSYEVLPNYTQLFDVALIPVRINELIINFNPLKLREYLAAGRPVVSTSFPEIEPFRDLIEVADGHEAFLEKVDWVLENDDTQKARRRADSVRDFSWESRFAEVLSSVDRALTNKRCV